MTIDLNTVFPVKGLLPKEETQVESFIKENPSWDGRNTIIAILDTGVDPGAAGLKITTTGKPKIIDIIDCTGSGDVSCKTIVKASTSLDEAGSEQLTLKGLSGKTLKIGNWKNPTGNFKLGLKSTSELYPRLFSSIEKNRKNKTEIENHKLYTVEQKKLTELELLPKPTEKKKLQDHENLKNELKARCEVLLEMIKNYKDPGYVMDCIVFHDGEKWRAAIDLKGSGDLTDATLFTNYADELQYASLCEDTLINFSVNIYDEGETLSIVTCEGCHGTHVAAIAAANFPDNPDVNGVAPGAQIVSLKIGDHRMEGMESGRGLIRALTELCRLKCDVANLSYGDPAHTVDVGSFNEILNNEVVNKTGCIFLTSAGNTGPALSTIGGPGANVESCISVGAYVNQDMMKSNYSLLQNSADQPFTFTSRGPSISGAVGTDIYAPGGATTSVPLYILSGSSLKNGTSMASPNCSGCVALLLSGLKQSGLEYNPYRIKTALINSSKNVNDIFKIGLVQVQSAWLNLSRIDVNSNYDVQYRVKLNGQHPRGIYLRGADDTYSIQEQSCFIKPKFMDHDHPSQHNSKINFEVKVAIKATQPWIKVPEFCFLTSNGNSFMISVDPTALEPGFYFGEVLLFDTTAIPHGPLVKIPVIVCKPNLCNSGFKVENLKFEAGTIHRNFVHVPLGANYIECVLKCKPKATASFFLVDLTQLKQHSRFNTFQTRGKTYLQNAQASNSEEYIYRIEANVIPGENLEITLAQNWSSKGESEVEFKVKFHGLLLTCSGNLLGMDSGFAGYGCNGLFLNSGNTGFTRIDMMAPIRKEEFSVSPTLSTLRKFVRPNNQKIITLKSRDILPNSKQTFELNLDYEFKVPGGEKVKVTLNFPNFELSVYDSVWDDFSYQVFNSNNKLIKHLSIYKEVLNLTPGTYKVKACIVSSNTEMLLKWQGLNLVTDFSLSKPISLAVYSNIGDLSSCSKSSFNEKSIKRGGRTTFFIGEYTTPVPEAKQGDLLLGEIFKSVGGFKLKKPLYSIAYQVPSEFKPKEENLISPSLKKPDFEEVIKKDDTTLLNEAVRDLEIGWLKKINDEIKREELFKKIESQFPNHLPLFVKRLEILGEQFNKYEKDLSATSSLLEVSKKIIVWADKILQLIDQKEVRIYFGTRHDLKIESEKEKKKEVDLQKQSLILALGNKCNSLRKIVDVKLNSFIEKSKLNKEMDLFDDTLNDLYQWLPEPATDDGIYLINWVWRQKSNGYTGLALKAINKYLGNVKNTDSKLKQDLNLLKIDLIKDLDWKIWKNYFDLWYLKNFPETFEDTKNLAKLNTPPAVEKDILKDKELLLKNSAILLKCKNSCWEESETVTVYVMKEMKTGAKNIIVKGEKDLIIETVVPTEILQIDKEINENSFSWDKETVAVRFETSETAKKFKVECT